MRNVLQPLVGVAVLLVVWAAPLHAQILEVPPYVAIDGGYDTDVFFGNYTAAAGADSSLVVVTTSRKQNQDKQEATAWRFAPSGGAVGSSVRLDETLDVVGPRVDADSRGGYVAEWRRAVGGPLIARLLDAAGNPTVPPFTVESSGVLQHRAVGLPTGVAFVWTKSAALQLRLYDVAGVPTGPAVSVAAIAPFSVFTIALAPVAGGFVVTWQDGIHVRGRVYDGAGGALGDVFEITDAFDLRDVAASPLGGFVVVASRIGGTHALRAGVWSRRYDDAGAPTGPWSVVDLVDPEVITFPSAAFDPAGRLYVAWGTNSFNVGPRARAFDPSGRPLHASFPMHDETVSSSFLLAARPDGRFFEGWRTGYDLHLQIRALCVPPVHTGCGDGALDAACERCDAGPANSDTTPDACRTTCAFPSCGDAVVDHFEQCDDGNRVGCDGCDADCNVEVGFVCGDGAQSSDCEEQCDDGPGNDDVTPNACRTDCRVAHCGDGVLDDGEGCDDGNRTSCDGCSDLCVPEPGLVCGDGIAEVLCGEQCDDGNAIVGDGCSAPCRLERIPGGGAPVSDCQIEWVVDNAANAPLRDKHGAFNSVQTCVDGDPRCDFDATFGTCTFHVRVCALNTDVPTCHPGTRVRSWELKSPSANKAAKRPALAAIRAAFAPVPGAIVGPELRDVCSDTLAVPIGVRVSGSGLKAGAMTLKSSATLYTGERDSDKLKLICVP